MAKLKPAGKGGRSKLPAAKWAGALPCLFLLLGGLTLLGLLFMAIVKS
jgi:hypothetical protein